LLMNLKKMWEKFWFIVWKDDSFKGWLISIIFLFVVIKFIFFPSLSLITGTQLPLAIVESCSMYHKGNLLSDYDLWWEQSSSKYSEYRITNEQFKDFKFKNGFNKGDILFIVGAEPEKLKIGDVIIFNAEQTNPVIHRIINIEKENKEYIFSTIGDHNNAQLPFEKEIRQEQIVGKAVFKLAPYMGWGKLIFYEHLQKESNKGFCKPNY